MKPIETFTAVRYVTPLRQGGSLPAIIEVDDGRLFVVKFRGAGQGPKALIAELIAGEVGRALGLRVPELAFVQMSREIGETEPHAEIRDLLVNSAGLNLGLWFIPNALEYSPVVKPPPSREHSGAIVWFDAFVTNVDRTLRNINILQQGRQLWLIDHGASMYFHHTPGWWLQPERSRTPFAPIKYHALLPYAGDVGNADAALKPRLSTDLFEEIVAHVPGDWLNGDAPHDLLRSAYVSWLEQRLDASTIFVDEANRARTQLV